MLDLVSEKIVIEGGHRLEGNIGVNGAKNAALPILAACILTKGASRIKAVPKLTDVGIMEQILPHLGLKVEHHEDGSVEVGTVEVDRVTAPYELVNEMRGSICVLGPLLTRRGAARVALPGGCVIGQRPIDLHLKGLRAMGAEISLKDGYVVAYTSRLKGTEIYLGGPNGPTVLGTCNVMMAATLAEGTTIIESAAREPEVQDLAKFLVQAGAKIHGVGTNRIVIDGVKELKPVKHHIIPDRIEAGTLLIAGAITGGDVTVENLQPDHLSAVMDKLREIGVDASTDSSSCRVKGGSLAASVVTTSAYPGIPTDLQPQFMSLLSIAKGTSVITEKVFPDRFMHIAELNRMGANIQKEGPSAIVHGVPH
ncbi:MAG: UDP-N-acetylglucosamine 1-carboxyvinyltransferase, partial [Candidatus Brocadiales bacterium]|nr:UDP-N-acetylglucosamine 1-carboxyvinyltransferase [Candidatus Bathyanammoxibius sp.]